uniref:Protein-tyrosine phosphatase containing protein n=1 Tax=Wuchereria bancrofti TaxID=6293 RepID=A0A1I8EY80_WUCBA
MCYGKRKENARRRREMMMHKSETETNSNVTLSKTIKSKDTDKLWQRSVKHDSLYHSDILIPKSRVINELIKNSRMKSEEEDEDTISLAEESSIGDLVDEWIDVMLSKGIKGLTDEFIALYFSTKPSPNDYNIFLANQNSGRNRYRNVVCLDNSRVKLNNHPSGNDYIHANYVGTPFSERRFICTQAPLDSTIYDFWFMIIQEKVKYIIMLTNYTEKGCIKSTPYFPSEINKIDNYNGIMVKCLTCERRIDFECEIWERSLMIQSPDMKSTIVRMSSSPIVLHCSAGIGRTGCLVLIELVLEKLSCKQTCSSMNFMLAELRKQRAKLIQNNISRMQTLSSLQQYLYVHRALLHCFTLAGRVKKMDEVRKFVKDYEQFIFDESNAKKNFSNHSFQLISKPKHIEVNNN